MQLSPLILLAYGAIQDLGIATYSSSAIFRGVGGEVLEHNPVIDFKNLDRPAFRLHDVNADNSQPQSVRRLAREST